MRKKVVIGFLGTTLDRLKPHEKWEKWRPTVSLFQHDEILFDRFEMIYAENFQKLAREISDDIASVSPETQINHQIINIADPWNLEDVYTALYDYAESYPFDLDNEEYYIHITTGTHVCQISFFLLTESRQIPAKIIQTSPPKREKSGPAGSFSVIDLDLSKYDKIASRFDAKTTASLTFLKSGIETKNPGFNKTIGEIEKVAINSKAPILLTGPTGAGKSHLAKRIYELKRSRSQITGEFIEVNCATIRGESAMSTLFGHKKGSFTGASQDRPGLLIAANRGVLFLDEIGELGMDEQAMLLRAIEEKKFLPLGADAESSSDFQLISGTNRDLQEEARKGRFRIDLLTRINLWSYRLPGLRDRTEDIAPNIEHELEQFSIRNNRKLRFNKEALELFLKFAEDPKSTWDGNFRDLNASITRMSTLTDGRRINIDQVNREIERLKTEWHQTAQPDRDHEILFRILPQEKINEIDPFDQVQLAEVIRVCTKSKSLADAGKTLFSASRTKRKIKNDSDRLRKYLAKFDLEWNSLQESFLLYNNL